MIKAGIKETKNNLSRYLMHVKAGEEVVITERGKPVARIIREEPGGRSIREILAPLTRRPIHPGNPGTAVKAWAHRFTHSKD